MEDRGVVEAYACRRCPRRGACLLPHLPTLLLACLLAPYPPPPFPSGEGGFLVFLCKGLRPLHPRWLNPGSTYSPCQAKHPAGWLVFFLARHPDNPRRRQLKSMLRHLRSILQSRKVLGGLGASFKKPPTLPRFLASSLPRPLASLRIRSDCVTIRRGRTYHGNGSRPGRTTRTVCPSTAAFCAGGAAHRHQPEEE